MPSVVETLADLRAELLKERGQYPSLASMPIEGRHSGRLLIYYPYASLADGAAEEVSLGFYDVDNVPPWDSWVCFISEDPPLPLSQEQLPYYNSYLVSWVPKELIEYADAGIRVNPEMCIRWMEEVDTKVTRQLRLAGLIRSQNGKQG